MTIIRSGHRFRVSDPLRGICGDCPGSVAVESQLPPTVPISPPGADASQEVLILDGFEHDAVYLSGDQALYSYGASPGLSLVAETRGGKTAGRAVEINQTPTQGGLVVWALKTTGAIIQYMRVYFKILSFQNTNGFARNVTLFGWTDATGFRYLVELHLPAAGGLGPFIITSEVPGGGAPVFLTTVPQVGVWYRLEMVQENCSSPNRVENTVSVAEGESLTPLEVKTVNIGGAIVLGGFPFIGMDASVSGNAMLCRFDDVRIQTSRPSQTTLPAGGPLYGPGGIWPMYPVRTDVGQWTPLSGDNFSQVDDFPVGQFDEDTSYIHSSGNAQLDDLYGVEAYTALQAVPAGGITAVQVRMRIRDVTPAGPLLQALYRDPALTVFEGAAKQSTDGAYINFPTAQSGGVGDRPPHAFLIYPDPLPTTFIRSQAIGVRRLTPNTGDVRVTDVWGYMDVRAN